jgi:hypothetical protein
MAGRKNIVVWLEGRPETVSDKMHWLEGRGYQVENLATAFELKDLLLKHAEDVVVIVTGRVLYAIKNLDHIDIPGAPTDLSFNAGFVVIDRFLRAESSPYAKIPILVVATTWDLSESYQSAMMNDFRRRKGHGPIAGMEKGVRGSRERFKKMFENMVGYWNTLPAWEDLPSPGDFLPTE